MREILFRGKRKDNGEWVYGNLFIPDYKDKPTEILIGTNVVRISFDVIPETVGQYTGLTDKSGTKIYEGDIVKITDDWGDTDFSDGGIGDVNFYYGLWYVSGAVHNSLNELDQCYYIEIIGNIYDNPELLKESE